MTICVPTAEYATNARAVTETSVITASCAVAARSYAWGATTPVNSAPSFAPIAENVVRSVTIIFANCAKFATSAQAVKEISVITASYAVIVRSYAWGARILAKRAPICVKVAENIVRRVTRSFVKVAGSATTAQAMDITVIPALCAVIVRSCAWDAATLAKGAPTSFASIAENDVRSVTIIFVKVAGSATSARAVKEISVITAFCAAVVRSYARGAAKLAKRAPIFVPIAESTVRSVTIVFALTAECATSARAEKDTSVIIAICAPIARSCV